jgi:Ice-binding-like
VDLGNAGNFAILTKAGISTTGTTNIIGDIGVSPIAATAITGFGLKLNPSRTYSTTTLVTGKVYAANYPVPTPAYKVIYVFLLPFLIRYLHYT